jgi:hypothetical protein
MTNIWLQQNKFHVIANKDMTNIIMLILHMAYTDWSMW